jgi:DNA-binding CsgD family transcriptional regulator/tetratricopeptide (TPR) repeat protein
LERVDDLSLLEEALASIRASGAGRLVLLAGEAGVGKTSLLRRFCESQRGSVRVFSGACEPLTTPRPLGPLLDFAELVGGELEELVAGAARPHQVVSALMRDLGASAGTVVVFEDMHWADEATLDALRLLGRRIGSVPALVLASYRDDQLDRAHPLRIVIGELGGGETIIRLRIEPLSQAAVAELARPHDVDAEELYRVTGGNPFFATEVLAAGARALPQSVRDAVLARAARLPAHARRLLEAIAVVPQETEVWLLEALAGEIVNHLEECLASGMLRSGQAAVGFRHELARLTIEQSLPADRRTTLHRKALGALLEPPSGAQDLDRLSHHAEAAYDAQAVLRFAPAAGERAASLGAHRESAALWARALRFAEGLPAERLAPMLEARSYECHLTDQLQEALVARERALELWRTIGDVVREGDCMRWLSRLAWEAGDRVRADRHAVEAVALLERPPPGRELAMAYSNRATLAMLAAQTAETVAWGERAIDLAERLDDRETLASALNNVGTAQLLSGAEEGRAALERSLAISLESGAEDHVVRALTNLAASATMTKDPARAERYLDQALSYCAERDLDASELHVIGWLALASLDGGRWREATDAAEEVLRRAVANPIPRVDALTALGRVRARRGDPEVWKPLDEALALAAPTGEQRLARVAAARAEAAWLARTGEVAVETDRARSVAREIGNPWEIGELACWRWRAGIDEQSPARVAEPYALQMAGEWAHAAELWRERGCPYEAALARADADDESALRQALAELQRMGATPAAAIVARKLRERGARGVRRGPRRQTQENPAGLTVRELDVLALLTEGLPNAAIAERLVVSKKTVDHHVSAILAKLGVSTRGEAAAEASRLGLSGSF